MQGDYLGICLNLYARTRDSLDELAPQFGSSAGYLAGSPLEADDGSGWCLVCEADVAVSPAVDIAGLLSRIDVLPRHLAAAWRSLNEREVEVGFVADGGAETAAETLPLPKDLLARVEASALVIRLMHYDAGED